jgi:hypothetical protein
MVGSFLALAGCAVHPDEAKEPDLICAAIADFANSSADGALHEVQLTTDWGGTTCPSDTDDEVTMSCKMCRHDSSGPGEQLCDYLVQHTATEFSEWNFRRVLVCLDDRYQNLTHRPGKQLGGLLNRQLWSSHAISVRRGISVGVQYSPGDRQNLPTLTLSAQRGLRKVSF